MLDIHTSLLRLRVFPVLGFLLLASCQTLPQVRTEIPWRGLTVDQECVRKAAEATPSVQFIHQDEQNGGECVIRHCWKVHYKTYYRVKSNKIYNSGYLLFSEYWDGSNSLENIASGARGKELSAEDREGFIKAQADLNESVQKFCPDAGKARMAQTETLLTTADLTQFKKTGRYEEVIRLCDAFQNAYPKQVRCFDFGLTPEGRPMKALVVSSQGHFSASSAHSGDDPVLLIQGGIHAGEIDGKDAGFWWIREALQKNNEALKHVTIVFVPVFNIDGHERFAAFNRPNQVGPEEMGWRVTSWNLNLNRDYTKAEAPEMQSMLRLINDWDPIVYADLHVTDGAKFQHALSLGFLPNHLSLKISGAPAGNRKLNQLAINLESQVKAELDKKGYLPVTFYPEFVEHDDPSSGFQDGLSHPRFSQGYMNTRNRIGLLLETHSWKDYATRVRSTYDTIEALVNAAAQNGSSWLKAAHAADEAMMTSAAGSKVVLRYEHTKKSHPIEFQGYAYKIENSEISNQKRTVYDDTKKQIWKIPLFDDLQPSLSMTLPKAGYVVEASQAEWVAKKLQLHGIRYEVLKKSQAGLDVETFRSDAPEFSPKPNEGRQTLKLTGNWKSEKRDLVAGALYIPVGQPHAILIANLLEPLSDESFLSWGFFNAFFERKEYMEDYVAEDVARVMLKTPAVRSEFDAKLKDKEFAKDSHKRLEFFYRKHSSWDDRLGLYPVFRVAKNPM